MDREKIFQWIYREDWKALFLYLKTNPKAATQDEIVANAIETFVRQYLASISDIPSADHRHGLEELYLLAFSKKLLLLPPEFERLVLLLVRITADLSQAYYYAKQFPANEECSSIIELYSQEQEKRRKEEASKKRVAGLHLTSNIPEKKHDTRLSLFKSN